MFNPFEVFIGLRYTRAKRRNHFISFISLISFIGIALGDMALITVTSVMNGFEKELRGQILGMAAHATIGGAGAQLHNWQSVSETASKHPEVLGQAPYVERESMVSMGNAVAGVIVRGVRPDLEPNVSDVYKHMLEGDYKALRPGEFNILLGSELATQLGVSIGDKITVIAPQINATAAGPVPRFKRFTVAGIFYVGMYQYDRGMVFTHMQDAANLFRMGEAVTGVRLKLQDMFGAMKVTEDIQKQVGGLYRVTDWTQQHSNFFKAVAMEKTVMFIIMSLIVAVAAFNIVSSLVMTVTDKESAIAILRTLGATPTSIMKIFVVHGAIIGVVGTLLGLIFGVLLATYAPDIVSWIEQAFGVHFLSPEVYYITELPSDLHWRDVVMTGLLSIVLSFLATLYPSWRASRLQPAEALRYE